MNKNMIINVKLLNLMKKDFLYKEKTPMKTLTKLIILSLAVMFAFTPLAAQGGAWTLKKNRSSAKPHHYTMRHISATIRDVKGFTYVTGQIVPGL